MTRTTSMRSALALVTLLPMMASASIPIAHCRPGDTTESGIQGSVTQAEIDNGTVTKGFNCNADIVGQYQGEGASWQLTAWKNCAYFDQRRVTSGTQLKNPGVIVLDVLNPSQPKFTKNLPEPSMLDPWESLKVNPTRQMLAGGQ